MTLLNCLQSDSYFKTLFSGIPTAKFELNKLLIDFQNDRLTLFVDTSLIPEHLPTKEKNQEYNYSNVELDFFFLKDLVVSKIDNSLEEMTFNCDKESKIVEVKNGDRILLRFSFQLAKLVKWNLFLNDT